ncbi:MAG: glycerophosphoryl diester phosphodiesterase [Actinomycetota bacterium]|nr:glycerophosphoryl diester phosphodiesterase [Actinomycetota bacterium]
MRTQRSKTWTVAHRGGATACIENTLEAVAQAVRAGADAVEVDARCTADGVAVLHHDRNLLRVWGCDGEVPELTLGQLRRRAPLVPTLAEMLAHALPLGKPLVIDLRDTASAAAAHRTVDEHGAGGRAWYCGPPNPLRWIRHRDEAAVLMLSWRRPFPPPDGLVRLLRPAFFNPWHRWLDARTIDRWHGRGIAVSAWTVDDARRRRRLLSWGIDAIISNDVVGALSDLAGHCPAPVGGSVDGGTVATGGRADGGRAAGERSRDLGEGRPAAVQAR